MLFWKPGSRLKMSQMDYATFILHTLKTGTIINKKNLNIKI